MQLQPKASLKFKLENADYKVPFGNNVAARMQNNPTIFTNPPVAPKQLQQDSETLKLSIQADLNCDNLAKENLVQAEIVWDEDFTCTANYVTTLARENNNDAGIILMAGFAVTKTEAQFEAAPEAVSVVNVNHNNKKGSIITRSSKHARGAKAYATAVLPDGVSIAFNDDVMVLTVGDKNMYIKVGTRKRSVFYNLPTGVPFSVTMFAVNSAGSGVAGTCSKKVITQ